MSLAPEVNKALEKFKSGVADLEKILNSQGPDGSGPNFAAAGIALAITEPIAKIVTPMSTIMIVQQHRKRRSLGRDIRIGLLICEMGGAEIPGKI